MVGLGEVGAGNNEMSAEHRTGGETEARWEGGASHRLGTVVDDKVGPRSWGKDFKFALDIGELCGGGQCDE